MMKGLGHRELLLSGLNIKRLINEPTSAALIRVRKKEGGYSLFMI